MGTGYLAFVVSLLLLAGVWSGTQAQRPLLLLCLGIILGPVLMSLQGVSVSPEEPRYLIFLLPLLLILLAEGIDWLAKHVRIRRGAAATAWGLTALLVLGWTPVVRAQFVTNSILRTCAWLNFCMQIYGKETSSLHDGLTGSHCLSSSSTRKYLSLMPDQYLNKVASQLDSATGGRVFYVTSPAGLKSRKARTKVRATGSCNL